MEPLPRRSLAVDPVNQENKKPTPEQTIASIITKTKYIEIDKFDLNRLTTAVKKCNRKILRDIGKLKDDPVQDGLIRRIEHYTSLVASLPHQVPDTGLNQKLTKLHLDEVNPTLAQCWRALGACYLKSRQFDQAMRVFAQAMQLHPEKPDSYLSYAEACIQKGELDKARETCERGLAFASEHPNVSGSKRLSSRMSTKLSQIVEQQKPW